MQTRPADVDVTPLDPRDDRQWSDYYRVAAAAQLDDRPYADMWGAESSRVSFVRESPTSRTLGWTAWLRGDVVGAAMSVLPMADNTHLAMTEVNVVATARRRGVGTALLAVMDEELCAMGRRTHQAEVARPYDDEADAVAGVCFARARGYTRAQTEVHYVLHSPLDHALLGRLHDEVDAHLDGYRIVSWTDRCPDEWVEQVCLLGESFIAEAPLGDLDVEPETWSEHRLRDGEAMRLERGQHTLTSVAVAPDGSLAGNTELVLSSGAVRGGVFQSGTLVLPAHRGHRLGLALKVANQLRLQQLEPGRRLVHTYNATENAPMIGVNARLGFQPVEYNDEWQHRRRS